MLFEETYEALENAKKIFFVGIGGISMSSIAFVFKSKGYEVSGSDRAESDMTRKLSAAGIKVYRGHDAANVAGADALIYTGAVNEQNPEIAERYIDFMLSEEAAIANAEYICYASPNKLLTQNADYRAAMEEIHPDAMEILYGTEELDLQFYENLPNEQLMLLNELWEDLKIESSVSTSIIVMASVIVCGGAAAGVFFYVRNRRRRRFVDGLWSE